jgi:hypothetical protein
VNQGLAFLKNIVQILKYSNWGCLFSKKYYSTHQDLLNINHNYYIFILKKQKMEREIMIPNPTYEKMLLL